MKRPRLLALDLDDTLLSSDLTISPGNRAAVQAAESLGVKVVLASGRAPGAMRRFAEELGMVGREGYLIAFNGAEILETQHWTEEWRLPLARRVAEEIWDECERRTWPVQTYRGGEILVSLENERTHLDSHLTGLPNRAVGRAEFFAEDPIKLVIPGEPEALAKLAAEFQVRWKDQANMFISKPFFFEILAPGADKGLALARLAEWHGFDRDEVMAIGDAMNDFGMLQYAGWPVAMANSVPAVKALGRYVTQADHDHDGVAEAVRALILAGGTGDAAPGAAR